MQQTALSSPEVETSSLKVSCPSVATISRLISGFGDRPTANFRTATVDPHEMARQLKVTFRPLPKNFKDEKTIAFRQQLETTLREIGVEVLCWEDATSDHVYPFTMPLINRQCHIRARIVRTNINAVFDVQRKLSLLRHWMIIVAEILYFFHTRILRKKPKSITHIGRLVGWSWDHAVKFIRSHEKTQVVTLLGSENELCDPTLSYERVTEIGAKRLCKTFSSLVICVSGSTLRVVNLNMADSTHSKHELRRFTLESLVPKLFLPIRPLPLSRFDIGTFEPAHCRYSKHLVEIGKSLESTGLLPQGTDLGRLFWQRSHQDLIEMVSNGRSGVSFGFVAFFEPPVYVGAKYATRDQWEHFASVEGMSFDEVRQNEQGRYFIKLQMNDGDHKYHQIPDIWLLSSRSGAKKTGLCVNRDVVRIGLCKELKLQVPKGLDPRRDNVKPSYDTYVMVAIGLSAALFWPEMVQNGAPLVHFHGYPSVDWFDSEDGVTGARNPSVPCGTFESGVLNFQGVCRLAASAGKRAGLICLLEPDHGSNVLHRDVGQLLQRLVGGCDEDHIQMGGEFFESLRAID